MNHAVRLSTLVLAIGMAIPAAHAAEPGILPVSGTLSDRQVHDYAMALAEIDRIRQSVADAPENQRPLVAAQAKTAIAAALERRGLDIATFNSISAQVEREHGLRQQVRQIIMQDALSGA